MKIYLDVPKKGIAIKMYMFLSVIIYYCIALIGLFTVCDKRWGIILTSIIFVATSSFVVIYAIELIRHNINMNKNPNYLEPLQLPDFTYLNGFGTGIKQEFKFINNGSTVNILEKIVNDNFKITFKPDKVLVKGKEGKLYFDNLIRAKTNEAIFYLDIKDQNDNYGRIKCTYYIGQNYIGVKKV